MVLEINYIFWIFCLYSILHDGILHSTFTWSHVKISLLIHTKISILYIHIYMYNVHTHTHVVFKKIRTIEEPSLCVSSITRCFGLRSFPMMQFSACDFATLILSQRHMSTYSKLHPFPPECPSAQEYGSTGFLVSQLWSNNQLSQHQLVPASYLSLS